MNKNNQGKKVWLGGAAVVVVLIALGYYSGFFSGALKTAVVPGAPSVGLCYGVAADPKCENKTQKQCESVYGTVSGNFSYEKGPSADLDYETPNYAFQPSNQLCPVPAPRLSLFRRYATVEVIYPKGSTDIQRRELQNGAMQQAEAKCMQKLALTALAGGDDRESLIPRTDENPPQVVVGPFTIMRLADTTADGISAIVQCSTFIGFSKIERQGIPAVSVDYRSAEGIRV
jgi:hypothetical protein